MAVPRQARIDDGGRVNQKRRTRAAIVDAARELLASGTTPTVADAARAAEVSRTTAYRYFPTQDSLLVEVAMNADVGDIEALVAADAEGAPRDRAIDVLELLNRHVVDAEVQYRTALRLYQDQWLREVEAGGASPDVREGRRRRWLGQVLEPLRGTVAPPEWDRLVTALCLLCGVEAVTVLHDVCHVDDEEAQRTIRWAAEALFDATFGGSPGGSGA